MMERLRASLGGFIGVGGAVISSLCCVLPVTIVLLGLGSGAFMATTMKYTALFITIGVASVSVGFYLHFREKRRCAKAGCRMAGRTLNLVLLSVSAVVVAAAILLTLFPGTSANLLMWATAKAGSGPPAEPGDAHGWHTMKGESPMNRRTLLQMLPVLFLALRPLVGATAETSVAHLRIDGMT